MNPLNVDGATIVQGGAVIIALYLIWINRKENNGKLLHMQNIVEKNTEAFLGVQMTLKENNKTLDKNTEALTRLASKQRQKNKKRKE